MFFHNLRGTCVLRSTVGALSVLVGVGTAAIAQTQTTVSVDANANRHAIDPRIYGVSYGTQKTLSDLNFVINRYGGNNTSRYNWQLNADNRGNDWYFESIADEDDTAGVRLDNFIQMTHDAGVGAEPMITIPMVDYIANLGENRASLPSFSVKKYGPQTATDPFWDDAGNGLSASSGLPIVNNPLDANVPNNSAFEQGLVQHLVSGFGTAGNGGVRYYIYDNEPSIWHATHRDVHPNGATMEEVRNKIIDYGTMIRSVDPNAVLVGPEEWGWSGYLYSGADQQYGPKLNWKYLPDRLKHNNMDYVPWLLDQLRQNQVKTGKRLLDIFTVHYYPQGGEFTGGDNYAALRNQSTRALWDPYYIDQSWINTQVQLIPRMKRWVNTYYPGTQIGITEYNWGAEGTMNGATTQADILGIFGREGLNLAARWTTPDPITPTYKAMKLYRNYDGKKSTFGDISVAATVKNPDNLSSFAAVRSSDGALTIMIINKAFSATNTTVKLNNFTPQGTVQLFGLTNNKITSVSGTFTGTSLGVQLPAQTVALVVLPPRVTFTVTTSTKPATVAVGASTTIKTDVKDVSGTLNNGIIDMEIYNAAGQRINQQYVTGKNFTPGQTQSATWSWTPKAAGTYTVRIGVFNLNWSTMYYWNNNACTIVAK